MNFKKVLFFLPRVAAAIIVLQTLFYKFGAHPDSVYIFSTIGMEPWGRIGTGMVELIAGIMLLVRPVSWVGAGLVAGTMMGAITFHLGPLGIDVQGDGGVLFVTAIVTLVLCAIVLLQEKARIMGLLKRGNTA